MTATQNNGILTPVADVPPSPETLAAKRVDELRAFLNALHNPILRKQVDDDQVFAMVIQLAIDDYGVGQRELAKVLQTQPSTVGRWRHGQSAPSTYSRPGILSAIATSLSNHIEKRQGLAV